MPTGLFCRIEGSELVAAMALPPLLLLLQPTVTDCGRTRQGGMVVPSATQAGALHPATAEKVAAHFRYCAHVIAGNFFSAAAATHTWQQHDSNSGNNGNNIRRVCRRLLRELSPLSPVFFLSLSSLFLLAPPVPVVL